MKKAIVLLYIVVVVVMAAATIVERYQGTDYVSEHYYGAWWFSALWALLAAAGIFWFLKQRVRRLSVVLLHLSLVVILLGALLTHLTAVRGVVPLRKGVPTNEYLTRDMYLHQLPFTICLEDFEVQFYEGSDMPSDYISYVRIDGEPVTISMNNIGRAKGYRIYQTSFDDDQQGSTFTISYDPWGTTVTHIGYLLLAVSMVWVSVKKNRQNKEGTRRVSWLTTLLFGLCGTAMASYMIIALCMKPLAPVLHSPFLFLHVGTIVLSYILLVVSMVRRDVLRPAVFLLMAGIFLGAVWAGVSWGTYWSWDPKEAWALVTLIIYSLPLHQQSLPWFRSERNYRIYSLVSLACLLVTYFGVNYLLGGMHSYV